MRAAIEAGADWIRLPYGTMQPTMPGQKNGRIAQAVRYAHGRGKKLALDLHSRDSGLAWPDCRNAVAWAATQGFDAIVTSDVALGLYSATHFPALPLHFVAPPGVCARTARLLKVQMNVARLLVPSTTSVAELVEITTRTDAEVEILASGTAEWVPLDISCNDPCYSPTGHLTAALRQLPLMAALGVRAIQVAPHSETLGEVASITRLWRTAIDRCVEDGKQYAPHSDWHNLRDLQRQP